MGRWDSDDEYVERITELFADLKEEQKTWLCKVAEQMVIDNRKEQKNEQENGENTRKH